MMTGIDLAVVSVDPARADGLIQAQEHVSGLEARADNIESTLANIIEVVHGPGTLVVPHAVDLDDVPDRQQTRAQLMFKTAKLLLAQAKQRGAGAADQSGSEWQDVAARYGETIRRFQIGTGTLSKFFKTSDSGGHLAPSSPR